MKMVKPFSLENQPLFFSFPPKKRLWANHPNSEEMLEIHRDVCGYCGCCVSVCPEGALELIDAYLEVDDQCTCCGICAKVCPLGALEVKDEDKV
jgi:ferredoxin